MAGKQCKTCGIEKPLTEFSPHAQCRNGVRPECKECRRGAKNLSAEQRRARLLHRYGLTIDQYDAMLALQGEGCAICGGDNGARMLGVDHCHDSGRVRGLLCHSCNVALGYFRDDPKILRAAIAYLGA